MGNKFTRRRAVVDERYTRPQGLYQHREVDHRKLRRLILNGQLAPCFPGAEDSAIELDECPICFLFYPSLNRSKCCTKGICTECFLQIKSPHSARPTQCPFCKTSSYVVEYRGAKTVEEKGVEQAEEQMVIEAKIRIRQKELHDEEERMLRREEDLQEGRIAAATDRFRRNFSNLNGFTLPPSGAEESELVSTREQDLGSVDASNSDIQPVQIGQSEESSEHATAMQMGAGPGSEGEVVMPGHTTRLHGSSFHRLNREDDFDLDLEDIMVMEAIWLSIQEQGQPQQDPVLARQRFLEVSGNSRNAANENHTPDSNHDTTTQVQDSGETRGVTGRSSVRGGLAGAIAALAERQVINVENRVGLLANDQVVDSNQPIVESEGNSVSANSNDGTPLELSEPLIDTSASMIASPNVASRAHMPPVADGDTEVQQEEQAEEKGQTEELRCQNQDGGVNNWIEVSIESGRALSPLLQRESRGSISDWMQDHSSEAVEVGTSFSSSVPSASDLPWEAPEPQSTECTGEPPASTSPAPMIPESFEEQMMLAMALSLAEAQAQARGR